MWVSGQDTPVGEMLVAAVSAGMASVGADAIQLGWDRLVPGPRSREADCRRIMV